MKIINAKTKLRALGAVLALATLAQTAFCSGNVKFETAEDQKVIISLENVNARRVNITIEDKSETKIYSAKVSSSNDLKKVFDLSKLSDGSYYLVASYENTTLRKEFTVKNAEIIAENNTKDFACQPVFRNKDEKVVVLYQCPTKESVKVSFKQDDATFFSHNIGDSKLAAEYDVSSLPTGNYEISLTAGTKNFTYDLEVD